MKTYIIYLFALMMIATSASYAQDIPQSEVPEAVLKSFNEAFPKASDVEWEREGEHFEVDFDVSFFKDHEAWFNSSGNLIRHKEEISKGDLPEVVVAAISSQYAEYHIDDVDRITENGKATYIVELEKGSEDRKVTFSEEGKVIE